MDNFLRADGRTARQLRPIETEQGLLNRADGSARFTQNKSSVLVAVWGPAAVKARLEQIDRASVEVVVKPRAGLAGSAERAMEAAVRSTLEPALLASLHPRTSVTVVIQVLHEDGSLLAACVNGAVLALLDAGLAMRTLLAACCCAVCGPQHPLGRGALLLDPDAAEEREAAAAVTFAFSSGSAAGDNGGGGGGGGGGGLLLSKPAGLVDDDTLLAALDASRQACAKTVAFLRAAAARKYQVLVSRRTPP